MRHVSLYRKWRPRTFDAVAGQEPVVRTLSRAIETNRVAHAYLFSGPRGTGKTSTAKVLAMGLNCEKGPTPEPDGTCESCRAIVNNSSMDVLEMDAASNRGIDEIRDLRDRVNLAPSQGRMKVYIIDEVHMLTTEAFNALLKMLEEPPEHVVFVLATTEKHKVLPTIISRCQSFDFRRPGVSLLSEKLREISEAEGIEVEPAALTLIAREGRGSFRDAEGLLDQLASFADGPITAARVRELLGSAGSEALLETTQALYERRAADALRVVDRLQNEGRDLSRFVSELVAHLRRLMLLPHAPEIALAEVGAEERAGLEGQASRIPTAEVVRMIEALGDSLSRAKRGGDPKLELELTFLKLARDYAEPSVDALLGRLEKLESAVATGAAVATVPATSSRAKETESENAKQDAPPESGSMADEESFDGGNVRGNDEDVASPDYNLNWESVLQDLKGRRPDIAAVYKEATVEGFDDSTLRLAFPEDLAIYVKLAGESKRMKPLQEVLEERLGFRPGLEFRVADENGQADAVFPSTKIPVDVANDFLPNRPRPSRGVSELTPETVLEPKTELPHREISEGVKDAPVPENEPDVEAGESAGADDTIQDQWEVLSMARELFGPGEEASGDEQSRGG